LVTRTLASAAIDVGHFGIVFTCIFLSYAVMGTALFGRDMTEFTTLSLSIHSCFLVLMGDFDAQAMLSVGREISGIWLWSFHIIIVLLMLNMLLAIIMDTYSGVKGSLTGADLTIHRQMLLIIRQTREQWQKKRVSLRHIEDQLRLRYGSHGFEQPNLETEWTQDSIITLQALMDSVEGLHRPQAVRLMTRSVAAWRFTHDEPMSLMEAMHAISQIHCQCALSLEGVNKLTKGYIEAKSNEEAKSQVGEQCNVVFPSLVAEPTAASEPGGINGQLPEIRNQRGLGEMLTARVDGLEGRLGRVEDGICEILTLLRDVREEQRATLNAGASPQSSKTCTKMVL